MSGQKQSSDQSWLSRLGPPRRKRALPQLPPQTVASQEAWVRYLQRIIVWRREIGDERYPHIKIERLEEFKTSYSWRCQPPGWHFYEIPFQMDQEQKRMKANSSEKPVVALPPKE